MEIEAHLSSETVEHVGFDVPLIVEPETTIHDVLQLLRERRAGGVLICQDGVLKGIFTERDALRLMASGADLSARIDSVMIPDPVTLGQSDTVATAVRTMAQGGYRRLPIVDNEQRPIGLVSVRGIVHYLVEFFPSSVYTLPPVPQPITQEREGS